MKNTSSPFLDELPNVIHADLKARRQPALFSTFPEQDPFLPKGCMTVSDFTSACVGGKEMLPGAGPVPLTVADARDVQDLVTLVTFYVQADQLEVHIRLDMDEGNTIDIATLCSAIKRYGPRVENMSLTIPYTVPLADFRALWTASQSMMSLRCSEDGTVPTSSARRPAQPPTSSATRPEEPPTSNTTRPVWPPLQEATEPMWQPSFGALSSTPMSSSLLARIRDNHFKATAACFLRSRWLSEHEIRPGDGNLTSAQPLAQMFTVGSPGSRFFVQHKCVLDQMLRLLKTSLPTFKPNIVVRCHKEMLRMFHNVLANLQPYCATLWVIMADTNATDWSLADLMLCDESCEHDPLDDGQCMLFLTGIVLSRCSRLTDATMPMLANVERVNIDYCDRLTSAGFAHLRHCTDVSARQTAVSDDDLRLFADATSLDISYCPVSPSGLVPLRNVRAVKVAHLLSINVGDSTNICW